MNDGEIFTIRARRCKRCGGLLTGEQSVKDGYGHTCKLKEKREREEREVPDNQITFFEKEN